MSADLLFTLTDEAPALVIAKNALTKWEADLEQAKLDRNTLYIPECIAAIEFWSRRVAELERDELSQRRAL